MALVLGPILRHVTDTSATVWVQTDAACVVEILSATAPTFEVQGHHYALVVIEGLDPDSVTEYRVRIDDEQVWPPIQSAFPASVIRTRGPKHSRTLELIFGSCRYPKTGDPTFDAKLGVDALDAYALRLMTLPVDNRPDALVLLGDQVYADVLTPTARKRLARRRGSLKAERPPGEVVTFAEYEELYRHTWGDPEIRWIMSTVPTAMIFDDHDIRDDWNTSAAWRAEMAGVGWWRDRLRAGLACYWVYQHIGNLSPALLAADPDFRRVTAAGGDTWCHLADLADRADVETDGAKELRFSFRWDLGRSRLIMIDSRNGRILEQGQRKMLSDGEFGWLEEQMSDDPANIDHLVLGSSLPWLLPYAVGDLQTANELHASRPGWRGRLGEKIRQAADLEHWPAFFASFTRLSDLIMRTARRADPPATITMLSGDVHHSYAARVTPDSTSPASAVHQLVCSPVHNHVQAYVRPVLKHGWSPRVGRLTRAWARRAGSPDLPVTWSNVAGPLFGNTIATLQITDRDATAIFEQPDAQATLRQTAVVPLT